MNATTSPVDSLKLAKWKMNGQPARVKISTSNGKTAEGEVYIQTWDRQQRVRRAIKFWLMIWGFGAFCIIFPLIHFVIPPTMLITGPIIGFMLLQQESAVLGGTGKCPHCGATFEIVRGNYLKPKDQWPMTDLCSSCREDVSIERTGS